MTRVVLVILFAATAARAESPVPATACVPGVKAKADAAIAEQRNEARFTDALAKAKLTPVALTTETLVGSAATLTPGLVVVHQIGGRDARVLAGPVTFACGTTAGLDLAKNARGELVSIERKPAHKSDFITACGCDLRTYARTSCTGARTQQVLHVLPDGLRYAGGVAIEYAADPTLILVSWNMPGRVSCLPGD